MDKFSMKWYKFVIYAQLFLNALLNLINAGIYLGGLQYQGNADTAYYFFPSMKALDIVMGISCVAVAAFAIVVRQKLAKFQKEGPTLLLIFFCVQAALNILYPTAVTAITGLSGFDAETSSAIAIPIVLLFANKAYFEKRKELFEGNVEKGEPKAVSETILQHEHRTSQSEESNHDNSENELDNTKYEGSVCGVFGTFNEQSYPLRFGRQCTVGRDNSCDIRLEHGQVSRMHCTIELLPDGMFQVTDYSANGTYYDNQRLKYGEPCQLPNGALLAIGDADNVLELRRREDKTDVYPFIHSRQFDEKMMRVVYGSPEILTGPVYASPEKMGKIESKENL